MQERETDLRRQLECAKAEVLQWKTNSRENKLIAEENSRRADRAEARLEHATKWLRQQAGAEKEPKARAAFIAAYNAVLAIVEGRVE